MTITVAKELGMWAVRLNGVLLQEYLRELNARRLADRLRRALDA